MADRLRWWLPEASTAALVALGMQLVQIALGVFSTPLLLNHLGKVRYSQLAILWALVFFTPLLDLGLPRVVARLGAALHEEQRGRDAVAALRSSLRMQLAVIACGVLTLVIVGLSEPTAPLFTGEVGRAFYAFCGVFACLLLHNLITAHLQGRGWLHRMTFIQSIAGVLTAAVPLLLIWFPFDLGLLASAFLCVRVVALIAAVVVARASENLNLHDLVCGSTDRLISLLREGSHGIVYFALAPLVVYGERYLIPALSGFHSLSAHLIAVDIGLRILVVPGLISQYAFRSIVRGFALPSPAIEEVVPSYLKLIGPLFVLPLVAVILFGHELVYLWLGSQADTLTVLCVRIIALALGACSVSALLVQVCIATSQTAALSRLALLEAAGYVGAVVLGTWLLNLPGHLTLMASCLWALRLLVNSAAIVRIVSRTLKVAGLWRLLAAGTLPGFGALTAAGFLEGTLSGPYLWAAKLVVLTIVVLSWWSGFRHWGFRPFAAQGRP